MKRNLSVFALFLVGFFWNPARVWATGCSASVSPLGLPPNTLGLSVSITVQNTGENPINWIEVQRPFREQMTYSVNVPSGWEVMDGDDYLELSGGEIQPGESLTFTGTVNTNDSEGQENSWGISANDTGDGGQTGCEGNLTAYSNSSIDLSGPSISNISVSVLSTTSVRVSWSTNEDATSQVEYGTSSGSYGGNVSDGTPKLSHSLTVEGLTSGATYYVRSKSVDGSSNASYSGEYSFTMPTPNQTITTETTITITETISAPETTKVVIVRDTTPPGVVVTTKLDGVYDEAPTIEGRAQDSEGVMRVQYSTDGGKNWLSVDDFSGEGKVNTAFSFTPIGLLDGNYEVKVRAFDPANNAGISKAQTLVIDRLPPRVGTTLIAVSSQPLVPTKDGLLHGLSQVNHTFIASAIGGAIEITVVATLQDDSHTTLDFPLNFNAETGLWYGSLHFQNPGTYQLSAHALDGAGNATERILQKMTIFPSGKVRDQAGEGIANATVTVYTLDLTTKHYTPWEGTAFGQQNPQQTQLDGSYSLLLPRGTYYLEIAAPGYSTGRTAIFTVDANKPLFSDFSLEKRKEVSLFGRPFLLPAFRKTTVAMQLFHAEQTTLSSLDLLVGKELPFFILPMVPESFYSSDLLGKPTVVTFLNTWSPLAIEQLSFFNSFPQTSVRNSVIFIQETQSSVELFAKRGNYTLPLYVDEDGVLVEKFNLHTVPTHFFLDSKGIVQDVFVGFLSTQELVTRL